MKFDIDSKDLRWRAKREKEWELVLDYNFWPKKPSQRDKDGMNDRKAYFMGERIPCFEGLLNKDAIKMLSYAKHTPDPNIESYRNWIVAAYECITDEKLYNRYLKSVASVVSSSGFRTKGANQKWEAELFDHALRFTEKDSVFFGILKDIKLYPDTLVSRCASEVSNLFLGERVASDFQMQWIENLVFYLWKVDENLFEFDLSTLGIEALYDKKRKPIARKHEDELPGRYFLSAPRSSLISLLQLIHHPETGISMLAKDKDTLVLPIYTGQEGEKIMLQEIREIEELRAVCLKTFSGDEVPKMVNELSEWIAHSPFGLEYLHEMERGNVPTAKAEEAELYILKRNLDEDSEL